MTARIIDGVAIAKSVRAECAERVRHIALSTEATIPALRILGEFISETVKRVAPQGSRLGGLSDSSTGILAALSET